LGEYKRELEKHKKKGGRFRDLLPFEKKKEEKKEWHDCNTSTTRGLSQYAEWKGHIRTFEDPEKREQDLSL